MSASLRIGLVAVCGLGLTAAVVLTREPVTIALWLLICAFAVGGGWRDPATVPLYLWLGVVSLYPETSDRFSSINEFATISGATLLLMGATSLWSWQALRARGSWVATVLALWVGWALVVYAPVMCGYLWHTTGRALPWIFDGVPVQTSALKVAIPVIAACAPALAVLAAIGTELDARRFYAFVTVTTLALTLLSLAQVATGGFEVHWTPVTYSVLPGRLHSISLPDPNGFARQLLFPILMLATVGVMARRVVPALWLSAALLSALGCLMLTQSRTAVLSCAAGFAVVVLANLRKQRIIILVMLCVGIAMLGALALLLLPSLSSRMSLANLETRRDLYEVIWSVSQNHLLFGVRPGGYGPALLAAGNPTVIGAHNMWLAIAVEWGWPMALLLTAAIVGTWGATLDGMVRLRRWPASTPGWREASAMLVGASAVAVTYCVHGLTEIVPAEFVFLALGIALAARFRLVPRVRAAVLRAEAAA